MQFFVSVDVIFGGKKGAMRFRLPIPASVIHFQIFYQCIA